MSQMDFFCSKDCPDLCGVRVEYSDGRYTFRGKPEPWCDPGFVCGKFNLYARREINNGLCSWLLKDGVRQKIPNSEDAIHLLTDFLTRFLAIAVFTVFDAGQGLVDLADQLTVAVARAIRDRSASLETL